MIVWQDPPPYVEFIQEAEALGRLSAATAACPEFGMVFRQTALDDVLDDFQRRAIIARVDQEMLVSSMRQAGMQEAENIEMMVNIGGDDVPSEQRERWQQQMVEYFGRLCGEAMGLYPQVLMIAPEE